MTLEIFGSSKKDAPGNYFLLNSVNLVSLMKKEQLKLTYRLILNKVKEEYEQ